MIDIDALEALAKAAESGSPGDRFMFALSAMDPAGVLALIAEVRALREKLEIPIAMKIKWSPLESSMLDGWSKQVAEDALKRGKKVTAYYGEKRNYIASDTEPA